MKKLDSCVHGHGHSETWKCQWVFVQTISSEALNLLPPNLVWWCIIMRQIFVSRKICSLSSRSRSQWKIIIIKICVSSMSPELLILLQLNLVWWHIIISWNVLWRDWIALLLSRSRSQKRFRIPKNVHLDDISSAAEPSVTKLGDATLWAVSYTHLRAHET